MPVSGRMSVAKDGVVIMTKECASVESFFKSATSFLLDTSLDMTTTKSATPRESASANSSQSEMVGHTMVTDSFFAKDSRM